MRQSQVIISLLSVVAAAPQAPPASNPVPPPGNGENGEMGGIFGMGFGTARPGGAPKPLGGAPKPLGGLPKPAGGAPGGNMASAFGALFDPKKGGGTPSALAGLLGSLSSGLAGLMSNFDPAALIPTGPEYPKGKMSLADYYNPGSGPYPAKLSTEASLPKHVIYAPIKPPPAGLKMPVLIWGNGGCTSSGTPYGAFLNEVASYGYLAIANGPPGGAPPTLDVPRGRALPGPNNETLYTLADAAGGGMAKVQDMLDAIDWVVKGNAAKFGNIDIDSFITAGSSCGGLEAYSAAYHNPRVKLIGIYNSGVIDAKKKYLLQELKAGVAIILGGPKDVAYLNVSPSFM